MLNPNIRSNSPKALYYTQSNSSSKYAPSAPPAPPGMYPINEPPRSQEKIPLMNQKQDSYSNESTAAQRARLNRTHGSSAPVAQSMGGATSVDSDCCDPILCCCIIENTPNCCDCGNCDCSGCDCGTCAIQ